MIYAVIQNGNVMQYPLTERDVRNLFPHISFPTGAAIPQVYLDDAGVVAVEEVAKPDDETKVHDLALLPVLVGGVWKQKWNTRSATPEEFEILITKLIESMEDYASYKENGGVTVGEYAIASNPETQHKLTAASIKAKEAIANETAFTVHWKGTTGWYTLDAPTIVLLSEILFKYVEAVFTTRFEVDTLIRNGDITTVSGMQTSFNVKLAEKMDAIMTALGLNS